MNIVTINPGTSSIKFGRYHVEDNIVREVERKSLPCTSETFITVLENELKQQDFSDTTIGIRIVHGGYQLSQPTLITEDILKYLESITSLALLHNPLALQTITRLRSLTDATLVAVFDTAFHANMPDVAKYYPLPRQITEKYQIRRYGFHGLAYQSMLRIYSEQLQIPTDSINCLALQLGSGCSICAIKKGQSIDTSMGFSPLEGLISRTRTGNIDPSVIPYLNKEAQLSYEGILTLLNKESGLKGVSGTEGHLQQIPQEDLAIQMFVYRIQQYIGAYDVALSGQYPILFGGGISEHGQEVLKMIAANSYLNLNLATSEFNEPITRITADDSPRHAYVIFVDEEREIVNGVIDGITRQ